jgi:guanylate cyclase soluble subunit beta
MEPMEITEEKMGDHGHLSHVTFKILIKDSVASSAVTPVKKGSIPNVSMCPHLPQDVLSERITIQPKTFCNIFPFHVLFDENLVVKQCGANVARWSQSSLTRDGNGLRLDDLFILSQPKMQLSYKHILKFCNATYILEARAPALADAEKDCEITRKRQARLTLKGIGIQNSSAENYTNTLCILLVAY